MAKLPPPLAALYLSDAFRDLRRWRQRLARRGSRVLTYVHQVEDPYSLLLARVLAPLVEAADAELRVIVLPSSTMEFAPDSGRLRSWALIDASRLATQHGLPFPTNPTQPSPERVAHAHAMVISPRPWREHLELLHATSLALLDGQELDEGPTVDPRSQLQANAAEVLAMGHYQGGMIHYEGEWFWGLDRLPFLEQRLRDEGRTIPPTLDLQARPQVEAAAPDCELELFYSVRSPYSHLALDRTLALAERHHVPLRVRLVLPMVMRGYAVPWIKRRYIVRDAKRIANSLGMPFGRIADPVGVGTERCLAVAPLAAQAGRLPQWLASVGAAAWAEGVDLASDRGLAHVAARAGLDKQSALAAARGEPSWRAEVEANREELLAMGLWGVPSYRLGELVVWGQDRLPVLEAALQARSSPKGQEPAGRSPGLGRAGSQKPA